MTQKNTKSVALAATTALLMLMVIGFGEAFAEMLDSGEWQMTTLKMSENSEKFAGATTNEFPSKILAEQNNSTDVASVLSKLTHIGAFDEVIRFQ